MKRVLYIVNNVPSSYILTGSLAASLFVLHNGIGDVKHNNNCDKICK